jgi:hypothetical protein
MSGKPNACPAGDLVLLCRCPLDAIKELPGPVFVYPQSELIACENRLWRSMFGFRNRTWPLIGRHQLELVQFAAVDVIRTRTRALFDISFFSRNGILSSHSVTPVCTMHVLRIQRWVRHVWWRRKAELVVLGDLGLNADMLRKCLLLSR